MEVSVKKLGAGDKEAVSRWFAEYVDPLYEFVYYRLEGDGETSADIVQETFLNALGKIEYYDADRGSMLVWLCYLSRNSIKKHLRQKGRSVSQSGSELFEALSQIETRELPSELLERAETAEAVRLALGTIGKDHREVLRQYYFDGASIEKIAQSQGKNSGAVATMLHRARAAFKKALLNQGDKNV